MHTKKTFSTISIWKSDLDRIAKRKKESGRSMSFILTMALDALDEKEKKQK